MKTTRILTALVLSFSLAFMFGVNKAQASCAPGTFANGVICGSSITTNGYFATSQNLLFTEQEAIMFGNYLDGKVYTNPSNKYTTNQTKKTSVNTEYTNTTKKETYDDYYENADNYLDEDEYRADNDYDNDDDYSESYDDYSDEYDSDDEEYNSGNSNSGKYKENDW